MIIMAHPQQDHVKTLIEQHLGKVEEHHQRIQSTIDHFDNSIHSVNEQNIQQVYQQLATSKTSDDTIDHNYLDRITKLFGIEERRTAVDVTFPNERYIRQQVHQFNDLNSKDRILTSSPSSSVESHQFIVEQARKLNPASFESEDKLFQFFTKDLNLEKREELMKFSTFAERLKDTHPQYYMANDPVSGSPTVGNAKPSVHRLLMDLPRGGKCGMVGCLQTILSVFNQRFGDCQRVPSEEEVINLLDQYSDYFEQPVVHPRPKALQQKQNAPFQFLLNHYLPQVSYYSMKWRNNEKYREQLIYNLKEYITEQGNELDLSSWDFPRLSQYPVVVKRNDKYYLILGIRYGESSEAKQLVWSDREDQKFWNSFPYFNDKGQMAIDCAEAINSDIKPKPAANPSVAYTAYAHWPFNTAMSNGYGVIADERSISAAARNNIMNGKKGIISELLEHNPLQVLHRLAAIIDNSARLYSVEGQSNKVIDPKDVIQSFMSQLKTKLDEDTQSSLIKYLQLSKIQELPADIRDIFSLAASNLISERSVQFWKYDHPETRPLVYLSVIRSQLCGLFPFMNDFLMSLSDFGIMKIKYFLQSTRFKEVIGYTDDVLHPGVVRCSPLQLTLAGYPLQAKLPPLPAPVSSTPELIENLPGILQSMRYCIQKRRETQQNLDLFLKGVLLPGRTSHVDYIQDRIKHFLKAERQSNSELIAYITLFSRLMNAKWKKPFRYRRVLVPTTREIIKKFTLTFSNLLEQLLNMNSTEKRSKLNSQQLKQVLTIEDEEHELSYITEHIRNEINNPAPKGDVTRLSKSHREAVQKYITHNPADIFTRSVLLLIDVSIPAKIIPADWKSVISSFIIQCRTDKSKVERSTASLIHSLSMKLERFATIEKHEHTLPKLNFNGDKFCVVPFICSTPETKLDQYLHGPREESFSHWHMDSISQYVTSVFVSEVNSNLNEKWNDLYPEKKRTLQEMLCSLAPNNINPPVLPLIPGELALYESEYANLHKGNVAENRQRLYRKQLESTRVTLYDCMFEGLSYQTRPQYRMPEAELHPATLEDVRRFKRSPRSPDWLLLKLHTKILLRNIEKSVSGIRINITPELLVDLNEFIRIGNQVELPLERNSKSDLIEIVKRQAEQCDKSERWCKNFLAASKELLDLMSQIDVHEIKTEHDNSCLTSVDAFLEGITPSDEEDFQLLNTQEQVQVEPTCSSPIQQLVQETDERNSTSLFPRIGDWDRIANFGKAKHIDPNFQKSNVITLEEAAFMPNSDRPDVYKNCTPLKPKRKTFKECDILVASGEWSLEGAFNIKLEHPDASPFSRLPHVNQNGVGWMNLDDFIAPGVNTGFQSANGEKNPPPYEWIENSFKYYPGESLDQTAAHAQLEREENKDTWYLTFDDHSLVDRKVRSSVPLWDLEFIFLTGRPWKEFESHS